MLAVVGGGARCTQLDNLPRASQRWSWSVHAWGSRASPERAAAEIWRLSMWGSHALREARHRRPGCADPVPSGFDKSNSQRGAMVQGTETGAQPGKGQKTYALHCPEDVCRLRPGWPVVCSRPCQGAGCQQRWVAQV